MAYSHVYRARPELKHSQTEPRFRAQGLEGRLDSFNELLLFCLQKNAYRPDNPEPQTCCGRTTIRLVDDENRTSNLQCQSNSGRLPSMECRGQFSDQVRICYGQNFAPKAVFIQMRSFGYPVL